MVTAEWVRDFGRKFWLVMLGVGIGLLLSVTWTRIHNTIQPQVVEGPIDSVDQVTSTIKVDDVVVHGVDLTVINTLSRGQIVHVKALPSSLGDGSLDASIKCGGCGITK